MYSLRDAFSGNAALSNAYKWCHSHIIIIKLAAELNPPQNIYLGIFTFWKLTEVCCFVTYLWNDPRSNNVNTRHHQISLASWNKICSEFIRLFAYPRLSLNLATSFNFVWHHFRNSCKRLIITVFILVTIHKHTSVFWDCWQTCGF